MFVIHQKTKILWNYRLFIWKTTLKIFISLKSNTSIYLSSIFAAFSQARISLNLNVSWSNFSWHSLLHKQHHSISIHRFRTRFLLFFSNFVPRSSLFTLFCMLWLCWWELQKSVMWFVYPSNYHSTRPIAIRPWILLSHPSTIYTEGPMNVMGIKRWRRCLYTWTICWVFLRDE